MIKTVTHSQESLCIKEISNAIRNDYEEEIVMRQLE